MTPRIFIALIVLCFSSVSWSQHPFRRPLELPYGPEGIPRGFADIDGDGDLDVLVGQQILFNDGAGNFLPGIPFPADRGPVAFGDLDGDGDVDAVTAHGLVLLQQAGAFVPGPAAPTGSTTNPVWQIPYQGFRTVTLGDLDGDGVLDAVFMGLPPLNTTTPVVLWLNQGGGAFTDASAQVSPTTLSQGSRGGSLIDLDVDGDLDLLLPDAGFYQNDGTGVFTAATLPGFPPFAPILVGYNYLTAGNATTFGDFDGDGIADVCMIRGADMYITAGVYPLWSVTTIVGGASVGTPLMALDADQDGRDEIVLGQGDRVAIHDVGPAGLISPAQREFFTRSEDGLVDTVADWDSDGDDDVLLSLHGVTRLCLADGSGTLTEVTADRPSDAVGLVAGDLDGDGDVDLLGATQVPGAARFLPLVNDGSGRFNSSPPSAPLATFLGTFDTVGLFDANGDGALDVLRIRPGGSTSSSAMDVYLASGGGWSLASSGLVISQMQAVAFGDLNSDGFDDVVVGSGQGYQSTSGPASSLVLLSDGVGGFQPPVALPSAKTVDVAVADLDGDGDLDIFEINATLGCAVFLNNGIGSFSVSSIPLVFGTSGVLLDADMDGDLDVLLEGTWLQVLVNDGTGTFTPGPLLPHVASVLGTGKDLGLMAVGDVTGDGIPDVIGSGGAFLEWTGPQAFTVRSLEPSIPSLPGSPRRRPQLFDMDHDGDLDLVFDGRVFWNTTRHLSLTTLARLGRTATLQIDGMANDPFLLAVSAGTANVPVSPFGRLFLDPSTLLPFATGVLDFNGQASFPIAVPPVSALVGVSLYWQAAAGAAPLLTNLRATTILP